MLDAAARAFLRVVDGKRPPKPTTPPPEPSTEGMRQGKSFDEYLAGHPKRKAQPTPERSPYGIPGVYEDDAAFIKAAMGRGKWADVKYYGPGAAAAEERRRETLGRMKEREAAALAWDRPELEAKPAAVAVAEDALPIAAEAVDALPRNAPKKSKKKRGETLAERVKRLRDELRNAP
jgi:hypothetical protein